MFDISQSIHNLYSQKTITNRLNTRRTKYRVICFAVVHKLQALLYYASMRLINNISVLVLTGAFQHFLQLSYSVNKKRGITIVINITTVITPLYESLHNFFNIVFQRI